jgi:AMP-polyphosphate phosphotransferase
MFEPAETGHYLDKAAFEAQVPQLRVDLLNAQYDLRQANFSVILLIAGDDRVGCNEMLHALHEMMDARYMRTHALQQPTAEEDERPALWRHWCNLPRRGQIGVFVGGWSHDVIRDRLLGKLDETQFLRQLAHLRNFEHSLAADGALLLKFWLHLPQHQRKQRLQQARKRPDRAWQLDARDWQIYKLYHQSTPIAERLIRETSTGEVPWDIIESTDWRYRNLTLYTILLERLTRRLTLPQVTAAPVGETSASQTRNHTPTLLDTIDLSQALPAVTYQQQLQDYQGRLSRLTRKARSKGVTSVVVFEGWDAAGKGGAIRRLTAAIDPENYNILPIAAPTDEEKAHHYLWRFWREIPRAGRVLIFDRSWYGRVLVERVEGFASEPEWRRAYNEINDFEAQLGEHGILLVKFWLHIDAEEQLRRFQTRQETPFKKYKLTADDYRNRQRWHDYELAVEDMVARTSTSEAPWHLVACNDKPWARIVVLKTYYVALKRRLQGLADKP